MTKAGQLFTWGGGFLGKLSHQNSCNELRPKRVKHGGFAGLFIVCASIGHYHSAAIDSSGLVPISYFSTILDIATLQLILNPCLCCYLSYGPLNMMQFIMRDLKRIVLILGWVYKRGWILFRFVRIFLKRLWLFFLGRYTHGVLEKKMEISYIPELIDSLKAYRAV